MAWDVEKELIDTRNRARSRETGGKHRWAIALNCYGRNLENRHNNSEMFCVCYIDRDAQGGPKGHPTGKGTDALCTGARLGVGEVRGVDAPSNMLEARLASTTTDYTTCLLYTSPSPRD